MQWKIAPISDIANRCYFLARAFLAPIHKIANRCYLNNSICPPKILTTLGFMSRRSPSVLPGGLRWRQPPAKARGAARSAAERERTGRLISPHLPRAPRCASAPSRRSRFSCVHFHVANPTTYSLQHIHRGQPLPSPLSRRILNNKFPRVKANKHLALACNGVNTPDNWCRA